MEANLRFDNETLAMEYLFRYPKHQGRMHNYSALTYYASPPIPSTFNETSNAIKMNITIGDEVERDLMMLVGNLYKWSFDYQQSQRPQELVNVDFASEVEYDQSADIVSMSFFLGWSQFEKKSGSSEVNLRKRYDELAVTGDYKNPVALERQLFRPSQTDARTVKAISGATHVSFALTLVVALLASMY